MAVNFPINPTNGDIHNEKGRRWIYDSTSGAWKSIVNSTTIDTDTLIEGNNLFYTDARVQTKLGSVSGHVLPDSNEVYDLGSATNKFRDLYLSGNSIELGTRTITQDNIPEVDLSIAPEILEIQVAAPAAGQDTAWLWTWEQSTLPYARRTITNSPEVQVPLYKQGTYTVNNYAAYDLFDQMTQTHSLYLKWIDGAGTDNLVSWAVDASGNPISDTHPDINGGNATDVQRINISVPSNVTPPTLTAPSVSYTVTNNGAGAYTFSGAANGDNPNLGPFYKGGTYTINITATGHPFYFTTDNGTNFSSGTYFGEYTSGVTGSRTDSGTITFTVPNDAPDTLYYQCGNHSSMRGAITVKDLEVETNNNGNYILYFQHTQEGHKTPIEIRPIPSLVNQMCLVYDASVNRFVPQDLATYVENTPSFENKIREVAGTAELVVEDGSAVVAKVNVYDDSTYLPLVGNNAGDQAFATDVNTLFIWDGTTWETTKQRTTDSLTEGSSNLYYTDSRVASYLSSNGFDTATNIVASITDSAPATLDTLNELAAALGDDPNFATTVSTNIGTKVSKSGDTMTGTLNIESGGQLRLKGAAYTHPADNVGVLNYDTSSGNFDIDARSNGGSTSIRFSTSNAGSASTNMFIQSSGDIGIGTITPSSKLHVVGDITIDGTNPTLRFHPGAVDDWNLQMSDTDDALRFIYNGGTKTTLTKSGDISTVGSISGTTVSYNNGTGSGTTLSTSNLSSTLNSGSKAFQIITTYFTAKNASNNPWITAGDNGVNLYSSAQKKFEVTDDGVNVTAGAYRNSQVRHSIRPSLNLDFANSKQLDPRITFYRDSIATYYDSKGVLRYANSNEPRFDHDPVTGESKGLLIEEARTNDITGTFGGSTIISDLDCIIQPNATLAPDGTFSAAKLIPESNTYVHRIQQNSMSFTYLSTYTMSVYLKEGEYQYADVRMFDTVNNFARCVFDLSDGTLVNNYSGTYTITDVGNGWYRFTVTGTASATTSSGIALVYVSETNNSDIQFAGNGGGIYAWGIQVETSAFPTSYVPSDTRFTSRSSAATYYDETGILRTAPANSPRYGYKYDGRKWVETGLILEGSSENLLYNGSTSSDLHGNVLSAEAKWTITDSSADVSAPDGSKLTTKGVAGTTGNTFFWQTNHPITYVDGTTYTHSTWIRVPTGSPSAEISITCYPQQALDQTSSSGFKTVTATEEWQRVSITFVYDSGTSKPYVGFVNPTDNTTYYFWGWQVEASSYPTSYITTNGSAVTRSADVASSVAYTRQEDRVGAFGDNVTSWYNDEEGTVYTEDSVQPNDSYAMVWYLGTSESVADGYISQFQVGTGGTFNTDSRNTGENFDVGSGTQYNAGDYIKRAVGLKQDDIAAGSRGIITATDATGNLPLDVSVLYIGSRPDGYRYNGHMKKFVYYPARLSDAELQALTENN